MAAFTVVFQSYNGPADALPSGGGPWDNITVIDGIPSRPMPPDPTDYNSLYTFKCWIVAPIGNPPSPTDATAPCFDPATYQAPDGSTVYLYGTWIPVGGGSV